MPVRATLPMFAATCSTITSAVTNPGRNYGYFNATYTLMSSSDINEIFEPVPNAAYSRSGPVARCHPGTREDVIAEIVRRVEEHTIIQFVG